ncbi:hypothetical protein [Paraburkholderia silvatlantica]|uniref:hypothetical protein n=1 Tax=Paraburkholderia silvatlantica TaxID=321895 RepID=UPI003753CC10
MATTNPNGESGFYSIAMREIVPVPGHRVQDGFPKMSIGLAYGSHHGNPRVAWRTGMVRIRIFLDVLIRARVFPRVRVLTHIQKNHKKYDGTKIQGEENPSIKESTYYRFT